MTEPRSASVRCVNTSLGITMSDVLSCRTPYRIARTKS